ncbi:hypothetical protein [Pseudidiomarina salilacus]|uniref:hypothetical protein n=1 Tax=Pseudidiomarina salilacus TaxID=3384452 RepID=UPI003984AC8B
MDWKRVLATGINTGVNKLREAMKPGEPWEQKTTIAVDPHDDAAVQRTENNKRASNEEYISERDYWSFCDRTELIEIIDFERDRRNEFSYQWITTLADHIQVEIQGFSVFDDVDEELESFGISVIAVGCTVAMEFSAVGRKFPELHQVTWRVFDSLCDYVSRLQAPHDDTNKQFTDDLIINIANFYAWLYMTQRGLSERHVADRLPVAEDRDVLLDIIADFVKPHLAGILRMLDSAQTLEVRAFIERHADYRELDELPSGSELFFGELVDRNQREDAIIKAIYAGIISSWGEHEEKLWGAHF